MPLALHKFTNLKKTSWLISCDEVTQSHYYEGPQSRKHQKGNSFSRAGCCSSQRPHPIRIWEQQAHHVSSSLQERHYFFTFFRPVKASMNLVWSMRHAWWREACCASLTLHTRFLLSWKMQQNGACSVGYVSRSSSMLPVNRKRASACRVQEAPH